MEAIGVPSGRTAKSAISVAALPGSLSQSRTALLHTCANAARCTLLRGFGVGVLSLRVIVDDLNLAAAAQQNLEVEPSQLVRGKRLPPPAHEEGQQFAFLPLRQAEAPGGPTRFTHLLAAFQHVHANFRQLKHEQDLVPP